MKLEDLFEFRAVPASGPKVDRPTPVSFRNMSPPLPDELCKDREWCERKKKRKKKTLKEMTMNTGNLQQHVVDSYVNFLKQQGKKWADAPGGRSITKAMYENLDIYGLVDEKNELMSFVTFEPLTLNNTEFYQLKVLPTAKNIGGGFYPQLNLLWTIKEHIGKPIIDYGAQSPKGHRFAQALQKSGRFDLKWYNTKTGETEDYNVSKDDTQTKFRGPMMTDWRLMIEHSLEPAFPRNALKEGFPFGIPYEIFKE